VTACASDSVSLLNLRVINACIILTLDLSSSRVQDTLGHTSTPALCVDSELLRYFPGHADAFCRGMLCISAAYAVMLCLSVRLSFTFVSCVKTNKHIFKLFSLPGSQAILVFHTKRHGNIRTGTPTLPLTGASNASGVGRNRDSEPISVNAGPRLGVVNTPPPNCDKL